MNSRFSFIASLVLLNFAMNLTASELCFVSPGQELNPQDPKCIYGYPNFNCSGLATFRTSNACLDKDKLKARWVNKGKSNTYKEKTISCTDWCFEQVVPPKGARAMQKCRPKENFFISLLAPPGSSPDLAGRCRMTELTCDYREVEAGFCDCFPPSFQDSEGNPFVPGGDDATERKRQFLYQQAMEPGCVQIFANSTCGGIPKYDLIDQKSDNLTPSVLEYYVEGNGNSKCGSQLKSATIPCHVACDRVYGEGKTGGSVNAKMINCFGTDVLAYFCACEKR